jgi:TonB family protein
MIIVQPGPRTSLVRCLLPRVHSYVLHRPAESEMRIFLIALTISLLACTAAKADQPNNQPKEEQASQGAESQSQADAAAESQPQPDEATRHELKLEVPERHWREVRPRSRVAPRYPVAAQKKGIQGSCKVRFFIDQEGVPYKVKIEECPKVFHDAATKAALRWRFEPVEADGKPTRAQFLLSLRFRMK